MDQRVAQTRLAHPFRVGDCSAGDRAHACLPDHAVQGANVPDYAGVVPDAELVAIADGRGFAAHRDANHRIMVRQPLVGPNSVDHSHAASAQCDVARTTEPF